MLRSETPIPKLDYDESIHPFILEHGRLNQLNEISFSTRGMCHFCPFYDPLLFRTYIACSMIGGSLFHGEVGMIFVFPLGHSLFASSGAKALNNTDATQLKIKG